MKASALDREVLTDRRLWGGDRFMGHSFVVSVYTTPGTSIEWYCYVGWTWWLHIRAEASLVFIPRPTNNWDALGSKGLLLQCTCWKGRPPSGVCYSRGGQTADRSRFLLFIRICLLPQCDLQIFFWQHSLEQPTYAKKPSPRWKELNEDTETI